jgi:ABC-type dipeptide/oligopeptide/nickel transport system permease subunit
MRQLATFLAVALLSVITGIVIGVTMIYCSKDMQEALMDLDQVPQCYYFVT